MTPHRLQKIAQHPCKMLKAFDKLSLVVQPRYSSTLDYSSSATSAFCFIISPCILFTSPSSLLFIFCSSLKVHFKCSLLYAFFLDHKIQNQQPLSSLFLYVFYSAWFSVFILCRPELSYMIKPLRDVTFHLFPLYTLNDKA